MHSSQYHQCCQNWIHCVPSSFKGQNAVIGYYYNSLKECKGTMFFLPLPLNKALETIDQVKCSSSGETALPVNGKPTSSNVVWATRWGHNHIIRKAIQKLKDINSLYKKWMMIPLTMFDIYSITNLGDIKHRRQIYSILVTSNTDVKEVGNNLCCCCCYSCLYVFFCTSSLPPFQYFAIVFILVSWQRLRTKGSILVYHKHYIRMD